MPRPVKEGERTPHEECGSIPGDENPCGGNACGGGNTRLTATRASRQLFKIVLSPIRVQGNRLNGYASGARLS